MKLVREHINEKFTEESDPIHDMGIGLKVKIKKWCNEYKIKDYIINDDFTINVNGLVYLNDVMLNNFPEYIQFNRVEESFWIDNNNFTTLRGCPTYTGSYFSCRNNNLKSLMYAPKEMRVTLFCGYNPITDAEFIKYACDPEVQDNIVINTDNEKFHNMRVKNIRDKYK
jgi:hypothetical protein